MGLKKWFYMRKDIESNPSKLKIYKVIFMVGFWIGLALLIGSVFPPIVPFGIVAGGFSAIIGGYFLLSIHIHCRGKG